MDNLSIVLLSTLKFNLVSAANDYNQPIFADLFS